MIGIQIQNPGQKAVLSGVENRKPHLASSHATTSMPAKFSNLKGTNDEQGSRSSNLGVGATNDLRNLDS